MNDGIILINKPSGITSFAVVAAIRRRLNVKCGHCGTLDPLATGLLPVICGKATKLSSYLSNGDKAYRATMLLGTQTDTDDITGSVTATDNKPVSLEQIMTVLPKFTGKISQVPPSYSAIKINGNIMYKLAREGKKVEIPAREVTVYSIKMIDFFERELIMDIECSKGTYIRSFCRDIARELGTVGTMSALHRTKTCGWCVEDSVAVDCEDIESHMISIDDALSEYVPYYPEPFYARLLSNGCAVNVRKLKSLPSGICRVYSDGLIGLGSVIETSEGHAFKLITHL